MLARVLGGLETNHVERSLQGRIGVLGVEHLGVDVQVLAGQNLRTHPVENGACRGTVYCALTQGSEDLRGPCEGQVAGQDAAGQAVVEGVAAPVILLVRGLETLVHGGRAAAGVGAVDDVVVNERGGLE